MDTWIRLGMFNSPLERRIKSSCEKGALEYKVGNYGSAVVKFSQAYDLENSNISFIMGF